MKNKFISSFAAFAFVISGLLSAAARAQTTETGPGPSEQPGAPMEMGQGEAAPPPPPTAVYQGEQPPLDQQAEGQQSPSIQEAEPGGPSGEGPAQTNQGVGRISMIHGDVSTQRGDSGDWSAAVLNQPILNADKISTGAGGRAEVQLDFANILRLGSNAQVNIANFTHDHIQLQLAQGLIDYSVFNESEAEPEVDTPNVSIHPAHKDVVLRIEVRPDGDTVVIVRKGEAQISTPKGITEVKEGEMATVRGTAEEAQYKISPAPDRDDWDRWNSDRDHMVHSAKSWNHTNRYYTGSEDLDANGRWENADDYGQVWVPNEPDDWAPYRDGNWVWEPYYGWTWVGAEPWGWAPYHYGRWMLYGGAWAWWPGPVWGAGFYRPFWAPAYVSFFGFGAGFGVGFGVGFGGWGGFGWLPIGPCDRFFPWWGGYGGRFGVVGFDRFGGLGRFGGIAPLHGGTRFSNLSHINDPHIGRALSTVGAGRFGAGHVTGVAATHAQLSSARMMTGNLPVVPTHASLSASGRAAAPSTIHNSSPQHFVGSQSTSRPQSFQQQTSHLQQSMQQGRVSAVTAGGRTTNGSYSRAAESRGMTNAGGGKPSSGTPSYGNNGAASRGTASSGQYGSSRPSSVQNSTTRPGGAQFPQRSVGPASRMGAESSTNSSSANANRAVQASPGGSTSTRSNWSQFSQPSHGGSTTTSAQSGSYWNRSAPSSNYSRGSASSNSGAYGRGSASSSRPQLNMRQPIVQPRSSGSYGGYGGYRPSPSYGGARGGPSYGGYSGGARSAPGYGGYSGGARSAPTSGGNRGGYSGGGRSAPSSGGGHSSGGHSSGGGHSGGGGNSGGGHR